MTNILVGVLIILACLAVMAVVWFLAFKINVKLESYRKYHETKATAKAVRDGLDDRSSKR